MQARLMSGLPAGGSGGHVRLTQSGMPERAHDSGAAPDAASMRQQEEIGAAAR